MSNELQNPFPKTGVLTEAGLAEKLGLSSWTVRRWRLSQGLPVIPIAGRFYYRLEAVESWLQSREQIGAIDEEARR